MKQTNNPIKQLWNINPTQTWNKKDTEMKCMCANIDTSNGLCSKRVSKRHIFCGDPYTASDIANVLRARAPCRTLIPILFGFAQNCSNFFGCRCIALSCQMYYAWNTAHIHAHDAHWRLNAFYTKYLCHARTQFVFFLTLEKKGENMFSKQRCFIHEHMEHLRTLFCASGASKVPNFTCTCVCDVYDWFSIDS